MFKSYQFSSTQKGTDILILGAVHGNETAGRDAQLAIIKDLQEQRLSIIKGTVTFIPVVNEAANKLDRRFVDINLNRVVCFHNNPQKKKEKIANELIKYINSCDVMLDLHSTHCPDDVEFAFIDHPSEQNKELLSLMPVKTALAGWPQIYADNPQISNFCTEEYAFTHNKTGITLECGYHKSSHAIEIAQKAILNVLAHYGCIAINTPTCQLPQIISLKNYITKTNSGRLSRNFKHLDPVKSGEVLAIYDNGQTITADFDGYMIMPNPDAKIGDEWFYLGQ